MGCGPSKHRAPDDEDGAPYSKPDTEGRGRPVPGGVKVLPSGPNRRKGRRSEPDDESRNLSKTASLDRSTKNRGSILRDTKDRTKKSFSLDRRNIPSLGRFKYGSDKGLKNSSTEYLPGGGFRRGRKPSGDGKPKDKSKKEEKDTSSGNILAGAGIAGTAAVTAGVTAAMTMSDEETPKKEDDSVVNGTLTDFMGNGKGSAGPDGRRYSAGLDSTDDVLADSTEKEQDAAVIDEDEREVKSPLNESDGAESMEKDQEAVEPTDSKSPTSPRSTTSPVGSAGLRSPVRSSASRSPTPPVGSATELRSPTPPVDSTAALRSPTPSVNSTAALRSPTPPIGSAAASRSPTPPVGSVAASRSPTPPVGSVAASRSPTPPIGSAAASRSPTPPVGSAGSKSPTTPVRSAGSKSPTTPVRSVSPRSPTTPDRSAGSRSPTTPVRSSTGAVLSAEDDLEDRQENTTDTLDIISRESEVQGQDTENLDSTALEALDKDSAEQNLEEFQDSADDNKSLSVNEQEDLQEEPVATRQDSTEEFFTESEEPVTNTLDLEVKDEEEKLEAVGEEVEEGSEALADAIDSAAEESMESATEVIDSIDKTLQESQESATEAVDSADNQLEVAQEYKNDVTDDTTNALEESQASEANVTDLAAVETEDSQDLPGEMETAADDEKDEAEESSAEEIKTEENVLEDSQVSIEDTNESATDGVEELPGPAEDTTASIDDICEESQELTKQSSTEDNLDSVTGRDEESPEDTDNKAQETQESSAEDSGPVEMQESTLINTEMDVDEDELSKDSAAISSDKEDREEETAHETIQEASESAENAREAEQDSVNDDEKSLTRSEDETKEEEPLESGEVDNEVEITATPDVVEYPNTEDSQRPTSDDEKEDQEESGEHGAEEGGDNVSENKEPIKDDDDDVETRTSFFGSLKNSIVETVSDIKDSITGENESPREEENTSDSMDTGLAVDAGATTVAAVGAAAAASSQSEEVENDEKDTDAPDGVSDTREASPSPTTETVEDIKESITGEAEDAKNSAEDTVEGVTDSVEASTSSALKELQEETNEMKDSLEEASEEVENKLDETLEDAKSTAEDAVSSAGKEADEMNDSIAETVNDIEDTVSEKVEGLEEGVASATSAVENVAESVHDMAEETEEGIQELADTAKDTTSSTFEEAKEDVSSALTTTGEEVTEDVSSVLAMGGGALASSLPSNEVFTASSEDVDGLKSDAHGNEAGQGVLAKDDTESVDDAQASSEPDVTTSASLPQGEVMPTSAPPNGEEVRASASPKEERRVAPPSSPGLYIEGGRNYLDTLSPFPISCSETPKETKEELEQEETDYPEEDQRGRSGKSSLAKDETEDRTSPSRQKSLSKETTIPLRWRSVSEDEEEEEKEGTSSHRLKSILNDEEQGILPVRRLSLPRDEEEETSPVKWNSTLKDGRNSDSPPPYERKSIAEEDEVFSSGLKLVSPEMQKAAVKIQSSYRGYKTRKELAPKLTKKQTVCAENGSRAGDDENQEKKPPTPRSPRTPIKSFSFDIKALEAKEVAAEDSLQLPLSVEEYMERVQEERRKKEEEVRLKEEAEENETLIVSYTTEGGVIGPADEDERAGLKSQEAQETTGHGNELRDDIKKFPMTNPSSPTTTRIHRVIAKSSSFDVKVEGGEKGKVPKETLQIPPSVDAFMQRLEEEGKAAEAVRERGGTEEGTVAGEDGEKNQMNKSPASPKSSIKSFNLDIKNKEPLRTQLEEILKLPPSVAVFTEEIKIEEEDLLSSPLTLRNVSLKESEGVGGQITSTLDVPRAGGTDGFSSDSDWADLSSREVSPSPDTLKESTSSTQKGSAESRAATKIQALYRGYTVRKRLKKGRGSIRGSTSAESRAATKIQALYRGYSVRKRLRKGGGSNRVSVPCLPHGLQKTDAKGKYFTPNRTAQSQWITANSAASKIQAGFRGYKVRKALKMLQKSHDFHNIVKGTKRRSI